MALSRKGQEMEAEEMRSKSAVLSTKKKPSNGHDKRSGDLCETRGCSGRLSVINVVDIGDSRVRSLQCRLCGKPKPSHKWSVPLKYVRKSKAKKQP